MIYTSYYAKIKKLPNNIAIISISRSIPNYYESLPRYNKLAPTYQILSTWKNEHNWELYKTLYTNQILNKLNPEEVILEIRKTVNIGTDVDICLVCYEKCKEKCHRSLVSDWLNSHGIPCKEYVFND